MSSSPWNNKRKWFSFIYFLFVLFYLPLFAILFCNHGDLNLHSVWSIVWMNNFVHERQNNKHLYIIGSSLSDEGPMLETLDFTIRIGSTPTFLFFDLYLYSAYAAHYVYLLYMYKWQTPTHTILHPFSDYPLCICTAHFPLITCDMFKICISDKYQQHIHCILSRTIHCTYDMFFRGIETKKGRTS